LPLVVAVPIRVWEPYKPYPLYSAAKLQDLYGSPVMHGQSVLKYDPLLHPDQICRGGTAIGGYVICCTPSRC
jgi:hypothetical protein